MVRVDKGASDIYSRYDTSQSKQYIRSVSENGNDAQTPILNQGVQPGMAQRTFGGFERHREHFETLLAEMLADEPDCLSAKQIEARPEAHPEFNIQIETSELTRWLEKASGDTVVTHPTIAWRYVAPLYVPAEKGETEAGV